jgi:two-component system phosphate regulon response regulator PhoB
MSRIVIIDGNEVEGRWLSDVLEEPGHRVDMTTDVEWSLAEATLGRVDLVMLSPSIPDVDSLDVLRRLKGRADTTEIPVLMIEDSEAAGASTALACGLGASDSVERPFDAYDVTFRVNRALEHADLRSRWWVSPVWSAVPA